MAIPFDEEPPDEGTFLEVLESILPVEWWQPMKNTPNAGYEILVAAAEMGERIALAVHRVRVGMFAIHASRGKRARINVELYRDSFAAGAVTVKRGSVVTTSRADRRFVLLEDVEFGGTDLGVHVVLAEAVGSGWEWNVGGELAPASNEALPGEIDTFYRMVTVPAYGDPTIQVRQIQYPVEEGAAPMLDAVAEDRGITPFEGETEESLALRARTLPDTVSPAAFRRLLDAVLTARGIDYDMIEVHELRYQECYDANTITAPLNPDFQGDVFVYDDPRDPSPFRNRYLDDVEWRGAVIIVVPSDETLLDTGLAYDDPGTTPAAFHPPGGPASGLPWRSSPAYDAPLNTGGVYPGIYDGWDLDRSNVYASLRNQLLAIRAAGVAVIFETVRP